MQSYLYHDLPPVHGAMRSFRVWILACLAALPGLAAAQSFTELTGTSNPFNGLSVGSNDFSMPAFADINNDGDLDLFAGEDNGQFNFFRNGGSPSSPSYSQVTGSSNPLNGRDVGDFAAPFFADLNNDGDLDLIAGEENGNLNYYANSGTAASPTFPGSPATAPFTGIDIGDFSMPALVDIDNDGDLDLFIGEGTGNINFYRNTGTASAPAFTVVTGSSNPFDGVDIGADSAPAFADLDGDGDYDCVIGESDGTLNYYMNTGTASSPAFTVQTGSSNPFNGFDVGATSAPAFADIDNDGDPDLIVGRSSGTFAFYSNTSLLPVELLWLEAVRAGVQVHLEWATASELNNEGFTVQRSANGREWEALSFVAGQGTSQGVQMYAYTDALALSGPSYYRLEQRDTDGSTHLSPVVEVLAASGQALVSVYPNPATDQLSLSLSGVRSGQASVRLLDPAGRECYRQLLDLGNGGSTVVPVPLDGLAPGLYVILVSAGGERYLRRVVVK
ncbi:MAG: FG-GAP-like repeat-containing protein [Bacteroidia bacterium]|nr:FG-GAP-like repeat-containing protein [Bacteroidia bacterium]